MKRVLPKAHDTKLGVAERICVRSRIRLLYGQARIHTHTHIENWDTVRHNIIKQYLCGECECVRSEPARKILLSFLAAHLKQKHTLSQTDCLDSVHTVLVQIQIDRFHFCHFFISYNYYYYYYFWIHFCVFYGRMRWFRKKRVTWDKIIQWTKFMRKKQNKSISSTSLFISIGTDIRISLFEKKTVLWSRTFSTRKTIFSTRCY